MTTALPAWLNFRTIGPRSLTSLVCNVLGERPGQEAGRTTEPVLIQPGLERC